MLRAQTTARGAVHSTIAGGGDNDLRSRCWEAEDRNCGPSRQLGLISATTKPSCESCSHLRLTATNDLSSGLVDRYEVNAVPALPPPVRGLARTGLVQDTKTRRNTAMVAPLASRQRRRVAFHLRTTS
ncbi:MAG: hypothetical protein IIB99_10135 [Planctomycetes bacterium]|nr:hypothetical protein [Planctomycetota bacterium]